MRLDVDGRPEQVYRQVVSGNYFDTLGVRPMAGRLFSEDDEIADRPIAVIGHRYWQRRFGGSMDAFGRTVTYKDRAYTRVVAVNEAAAAAFFGGRNPIGEEIDFGEAGAYRVVGVVRDHKHRSVREETPRFAYVPLWQPIERISRITLSVSSTQQAAALSRAAADQARAVASTALVSDVLGVQEQIDATLVTERLLSTLATGFAALALVVAAIGVYGVLSYALVRRTTELGVRLALGARPAHVAASVLRGVLAQVLLGIGLGLPLALVAVRAAEGLLFGVSSAEPWSYVIGAATLTAIACLAASIPARRAASIDPCRALRHQ